jgi:hypothetical protein
MPTRDPKPRRSKEEPAEHDASSLPRPFTGWHYYLACVLEKTQTPGFQVHSFVKLGTLPLEADIILLHRDKNADIQVFAKYFDFLLPSLRPYVVLEYKSPDSRLTLADFDTVRAYAMLCKRKYGVARDGDVAVAMLYSRCEAGFFEGCADHGFPFSELKPGVRASCHHSMGFFAVDLVALGQQQPDHPINLLSARRRLYEAAGLEGGLGPFAVLYEELFLRELKKMSQKQVRGYQELLDDAERLNELILSRASVERRLRGIPPEEMLRHLNHDEVLRYLSPEERVRGLPIEDRLRGLSPAERARLRELLLKQDC